MAAKRNHLKFQNSMPKPAVSPDAKVSEFAVCQSLSRILGIRPETPDATVIDLCDAFMQAAEPHGLYWFIGEVAGLYPWGVDVAGEIMSDKLRPLMEFLISRPGMTYVAKDKVRSGPDSIWVVSAEPTERLSKGMLTTPCRGLFHSVRVGEDVIPVVAIQLITCNQK